MQIETLLQTYFGYDEFRPGQREIINEIINGRDVIGVLPTGGGKSLCYQIPALASKGLTLIISPLISLMKDQVDALEQMDIPAGRLDSQVDGQSFADTMRRARNGELKLLYIAPERLQSANFIEALRHLPIDIVAVDEAHCVSQWGHDFRPSYRLIAESLATLPKRPVFAAFTATATQQVRDDIVAQLSLKDPFRYVASFDRPNLYFNVQQPNKRQDALLRALNDGASAIVYCATRRTVEMVTDLLNDNGVVATRYHAGLSTEERERNQEDFSYDRVQVIVATNAFGMGIDKPDVRRVIHYNMPKNIESYYQEAGRAGRDGAPAEALLLFSAQDIVTNLFLINQTNEPFAREKLNAMIGYTHTGNCLRSYLLRYFGESGMAKCDHCAICEGAIDTVDITVEAQKILSCIARTGQRFGMKMVIDVLRGSKNQRLLEWKFDQLSTYGIMKKSSEQEVRDIITLLASEGYIFVAGTDYPILKLTAKSSALLQGKDTIAMNRLASTGTKRKNKASFQHSFDEELFTRLRNLRGIMAKNLSLPPYVIFSDRTLMDLATRCPKTVDELLDIHGIGKVKKEKYGAPFLSVIRGYIDEKMKDLSKDNIS